MDERHLNNCWRSVYEPMYKGVMLELCCQNCAFGYYRHRHCVRSCTSCVSSALKVPVAWATRLEADNPPDVNKVFVKQLRISNTDNPKNASAQAVHDGSNGDHITGNGQEPMSQSIRQLLKVLQCNVDQSLGICISHQEHRSNDDSSCQPIH